MTSTTIYSECLLNSISNQSDQHILKVSSADKVRAWECQLLEPVRVL